MTAVPALGAPVLVDIAGLSVAYEMPQGMVPALRDITLQVRRGDVLGLVGESGSGKSTLANALMALLPAHAQTSGRLAFEGIDLLGLTESDRRALRGDRIAAVFQDPFTALNPVVRIGRQLVEFQHRQRDVGVAERRRRALEMLMRVGIADPRARLRQYPFELSGGIRQRVAIAAALLTGPELLVADEPTTALDATTGRQIIALLRESRALVGGAMVIVTHDLGVVASLCNRVAVLYAGELMEVGETAQMLAAPRHPYTRALLGCDLDRTPAGRRQHRPFATIPGRLPERDAVRSGCAFEPRCETRLQACSGSVPPRAVHPGGFARCHACASVHAA